MKEEMDEQNKEVKQINNNRSYTEMITKLPLITKDNSSCKYLHNRPELNEKNRTCILDDGSRFFLKRRNTKQNKIESKLIGNLLSKSMTELIKEADNTKIKILTNKKNIAYDEKQYELFGNEENTEMGEFSLPEKSLWVDKYSPKSFSQLLSPEKINREVLKALKSWDNYVFRETKNVPSSSVNQENNLNYLNNFNNLPKSPKNGKKRKNGDEEDETDDYGENNFSDHKQVSSRLLLKLL